LLANFTEVSKGRDWPREEKSIAQKKTGEGKGVAVTEEVVPNNRDVLALIFYHHYSSR